MRFVQWVQRYWVLFILVAISGVVGLVYGAMATNSPTDPDTGTWKMVASAMAVVVIALTLLQRIFGDMVDRRLKSDIQQARAATLDVVNGALMPIAHRLVEVAALDQRRRAPLVEGIREAVVASAIGLIETEDCRVSYFPVEGERGSRVMTRHISRSGARRTDEPTSTFREGESANSAVWDLVDAGGFDFYEDITVDVPQSWSHPKTPAYKTFISVGVAADGVGFGLLTVNALEEGQLVSSDLATMRALAYLLACAEALGKGTQGLNQARRSTSSPASLVGDNMPASGGSDVEER